jgi:6-pyruvoyltetrahydropterin/6-carboxytetrahydropterin synthase
VYTVTKEFSFCAAHRLEGHPKCGRLHGHNYRCEVMVSSSRLDKGIVKKMVEDRLDHRYLISRSNVAHGDPYAKIAIAQEHSAALDIDHTTAEELAYWIADVVRRNLAIVVGHSNFRLDAVNLWETPTSCASYVPGV